jgi:hypothetical protein
MEAYGAAMLIMLILMILMIVGIVKVIFKGPAKNPTWKGIIISAWVGLLPLYLIFCFLGWMGEERDRY